MAVSGVFLFVAKYVGSWEMLIIGRLLIGVNSGLNAGLAPMYLTEISPTALRGAVGTVYQLIITISILLSQVLGMNVVLGNDAGWPFLFGLTVVPGVLQLITLPFCPESPKYLLLDKNDEAKANDSLTWLRGTNDVASEMDEMRVEHEAMKALPKTTFKEMLTNPALRSPLIIAVMMMLAQQVLFMIMKNSRNFVFIQATQYRTPFILTIFSPYSCLESTQPSSFRPKSSPRLDWMRLKPNLQPWEWEL